MQLRAEGGVCSVASFEFGSFELDVRSAQVDDFSMYQECFGPITMQIVRTIAEIRSACRSLTRGGAIGPQTLGLVPTMGALHEGHLSLVRAARRECDRVAVTIFVNPLQFSPTEDLAKYPRTFEQDCELLEHEGVDVVFAPAAEEMTPATVQSYVDVPLIGARLDGASRPGHFRGVATIVTKLFHITQPDRAYFGQKDAAQVAVLRQMVRDLDFGIELVVCPTMRETDGLAMSSRNRYLTAEERMHALALSRALEHVEELVAQGQRDAAELETALLKALQSAKGVRLDYATIADPDTLEPVRDVARGALVAVAAWVGATRLIDNVVVERVKELV
jgi:pantoate--beta-alanine ligase